jgi:hypothetical protein
MGERTTGLTLPARRSTSPPSQQRGRGFDGNTRDIVGDRCGHAKFALHSAAQDLDLHGGISAVVGSSARISAAGQRYDRRALPQIRRTFGG